MPRLLAWLNIFLLNGLQQFMLKRKILIYSSEVKFVGLSVILIQVAYLGLIYRL